MPKTRTPLSRRKFLGAAAAATTGTLAFPHLAPARTVRDARARNVIFLVADGMNIGTLSLANNWLQETAGRDTNWIRNYRDPAVRHTLQEVRSANALVPDSAAAGSAWGIGEPVNNRALNTTPDGRTPTPLWIKAREFGRRTGLVTTTRLTHATPAAFAVNVPHRNEEETIARQYLDRQIDVLLGGGTEKFSAAQREDGEDLLAAYKNADYTVVHDREDLLDKAQPGKKLLGTFYTDHLPYSIDRDYRPELQQKVPTLAEMTEAALRVLSGSEDGFALMVEGGRIDHAGHARDAAAILHDQLAFDAIIDLALNYARDRGDTLVFLTTDHGTGGCILNGAGRDYLGTNAKLANLSAMRYSFEHMGQRILAGDPVADALQDGLAFELPQEALDEATKLAENATKPSDLYGLSNILYPLVNDRTAVNFTSNQHTGELVEMAVLGPGIEILPAVIKNYNAHQFVTLANGWHS